MLHGHCLAFCGGGVKGIFTQLRARSGQITIKPNGLGMLGTEQETSANLTVWMPEGIDHVESVFKPTDEYQRRLIDFFTAALR